MTRPLLALLFLVTTLVACPLAAQDDETVPVSITSPDTATTYAYGTIKHHELIWQSDQKLLVVSVTFTDQDLNLREPSEETLEFRLPGLSYDMAKNVIFATTAKGEAIPVAHFKKTLFFKQLETLPNARVRILHPRGNVSVILEAIRPDDPAMHSHSDDPNGTHEVAIPKILQ